MNHAKTYKAAIEQYKIIEKIEKLREHLQPDNVVTMALLEHTGYTGQKTIRQTSPLLVGQDDAIGIEELSSSNGYGLMVPVMVKSLGLILSQNELITYRRLHDAPHRNEIAFMLPDTKIVKDYLAEKSGVYAHEIVKTESDLSESLNRISSEYSLTRLIPGLTNDARQFVQASDNANLALCRDIRDIIDHKGVVRAVKGINATIEERLMSPETSFASPNNNRTFKGALLGAANNL